MENVYAIVTGANRGLGRQTALELGKKGYHLILTARSETSLQEVAEGIKKLGRKCETQKLDISKKSSVDQFDTWLKKNSFPIGILVNNAGVYLETPERMKNDNPTVLNVPEELILETFETNTLGAYRMCKAVIPYLIKNKGGCIVNVSSGMGQLSEMGANYPGYRLSKTALNALTRILANEIDNTNIKINSVCPGWVRTDMGGPNATRTISEGTSGIVWAATLTKDGPTGGFFRDGKAIAW